MLKTFLQRSAEIAPTVFGDGLRCAGGSLKRSYAKYASSGSVSAPAFGDPSISARSLALGDAIGVGAARVHQVHYRDPSLSSGVLTGAGRSDETVRMLLLFEGWRHHF